VNFNIPPHIVTETKIVWPPFSMHTITKPLLTASAYMKTKHLTPVNNGAGGNCGMLTASALLFGTNQFDKDLRLLAS
jgi:hypothetical protein